jgi:hypothetical protein
MIVRRLSLSRERFSRPKKIGRGGTIKGKQVLIVLVGRRIFEKISVNEMVLNRVIHCRRTFDVDAQICNSKRLKDLSCEKKKNAFFSEYKATETST